jgi:CRP-like cAMP-binding protein
MPANTTARTPDGALADPRTNRLLAALPAEDYAPLRAHLELVAMPVGRIIYEPHTLPAHVYFPLSGSSSVVVGLEDGEMVEAGTVGREGIVGLAAFLGTDTGPLTTLCQVPGVFARLPVAVFRDAAAPGSRLHTILLRFTQAFYVLAAQSTGCNALHPLAGRCARWLLLTHDRADGDTFRLTHEYLGYMLGVRRPSVSVALATLQGAGLIAYHRGDVTVADRAGLEAAACGCYAIISAEYDKLLR